MKIIAIILMSTFLIASCSAPPKIFYLNSYHEGYGSSDDITQGIVETLSKAGIDPRIFYMDTKRQNSPEYFEFIAKEAMAAIQAYNPDVIIASDDNAVKYVITPFFKDGPIPVVFCGVNWSCEQYGLPTDYVTGMLEVLPLDTAFITLKKLYPGAKNLTILSENTTSEHNNKKILDPLYRDFGFEPTYALVDNYSDWKKAFIKANESSDLIFFVTNGAIRYWNPDDAMPFVAQTIKKPVFTADDFMMDYAVFGFTKVAKEQGIWAAEKAIDILNGASPQDITVTKNQQAKTLMNQKFAEKVDFKKPANLTINFEPIE